MMECTNCNDWFHPQCINADYISYTAMKRCYSSSDDFLCPVCINLSCCISNYSFEPTTEWNLMQHTVHVNNNYNNKNSKMNSINKSRSNNNNLGNKDNSSNKRNKTKHIHKIDVRGPNMLNDKQQKLKIPLVKYRHYLTIVELKQALAVENDMPIVKVNIHY